jgi:hypothetical protein
LVSYQNIEGSAATRFTRRAMRMIRGTRAATRTRATGRRAAALRRIVVALAALLLQLTLFAAPAHAAHDGLAGHGHAIATPHCDAHDADRAPLDGRRDHPHCCLLCEWSGRIDYIPLDSFDVASATPPATPAARLRPASDRMRETPIGWTTSWSSRAPPSLS